MGFEGDYITGTCYHDDIDGISYCKVPKFSDTKNVAETTPKLKKKDLSIEKLCPKSVDGMASSVDPDQTAQTAPLGAV